MINNVGRQESTYPSQSFPSRLGKFFSSEQGISLISVLVVLLLWFVNAAQSLGASGWQVLTYVIFPSYVPDLFTGLRVAIGVAYSTLVAAESCRSKVGFNGRTFWGIGCHDSRIDANSFKGNLGTDA